MDRLELQCSLRPWREHSISRPALQRLLRDAQYLGFYGRDLPTLDSLTASNLNSSVYRARGFDALISISPETDF